MESTLNDIDQRQTIKILDSRVTEPKTAFTSSENIYFYIYHMFFKYFIQKHK